MKKLFLCSLFFLLNLTILQAQTLIIRAFDNADSSDGSNDYILLENVSGGDLDVSGYIVRSFASTGNDAGHANYTFPTTTILASGQRWLIISGDWSPAIPTEVQGKTVDGNYGAGNFSATAYLAVSDGTTCIDGLTAGSGHTADGTTDLGMFCPTLVPAPTPIGGLAVDDNLVIRSSNTAFPPNTDWSEVAETGSSLPISLASFDASVQNHAVTLQWITASESNNLGFAIEQLMDSEWNEMAWIGGKGNSIESNTYTQTLDHLSAGKHSFRLRQEDTDGKTYYSDVLTVLIALEDTHELSELYPNPFNPLTNFTVVVAQTQAVTISVFNMLGQQVKTLHTGELLANEVNTFTFSMDNLPSGNYILQVQGETFVATKQALLLK